MLAKYTYLLIDIGAVAVPFIFSFHSKIRFYEQWGAYFRANLIVALAFLWWDALYTHLGVWGFSKKYTLGATLFGLPIEEVLFFVCIPYACVFSYHCFKLFVRPRLKEMHSVLTLSLIVFLLTFGIISFGNLYTGPTFILLAVFLSYLHFIGRVTWLHWFYLVFAFILIPFFIVNGILTGTGLDEPIVWYNNSENLNIRIFTVPFEDIFYGMLLLILNTALFERFALAYGKEKDTRIPV